MFQGKKLHTALALSPSALGYSENSSWICTRPTFLVVIRLVRISEIEHNRGMRFSTSAIAERRHEIDRAVEMQGSIRIDIDVEGFEVRRGVDKADLPCLHKVVGDDDVFLVRGHFDVMRADRRLLLVGIVEAFGVFQVGDVQGSYVICCCYCCWWGVSMAGRILGMR